MKSFLADNLKVETEVKNAIRLKGGEGRRGNEVILVKLQDWKNKRDTDKEERSKQGNIH